METLIKKACIKIGCVAKNTSEVNNYLYAIWNYTQTYSQVIYSCFGKNISTLARCLLLLFFVVLTACGSDKELLDINESAFNSSNSNPDETFRISWSAADNNILLEWDDVSGATHYNISRDSALLVGNVTTNSYIDTNVSRGNYYSYEISSCDRDDCSLAGTFNVNYALLIDAVDLAANRTAEMVANKTVDAVANKTVDAVANKTMDAVANKTVDAIANKTVDAIANKTVDAVVNKTVDAIANKTVDAVANKTVDAVVNKTVDAFANKTVDATANKTVDAIANKTVDAKTKLPVPMAMRTDLSWSVIDEKILLEWDDVSNATHYNIMRDGALLMSNITKNNYTDTSVIKGNYYNYNILSCNREYCSLVGTLTIDYSPLVGTAHVEDTNVYKLTNTAATVSSQINGKSYLFVASNEEDGVSVFRVGDNASLIHVDSVDDADDAAYQLDGANAMSAADIGNSSYLFVAGGEDDGVSVFRIADNGSLSHVDSVDDGEGNYELDNPSSITTAEIGGTSYLFVAGETDNGISVFSVAASGLLRHVDSVDDGENAGTYNLRGANSVTVAAIEGTSYLFVAGLYDSGVSVFSVAASGLLRHVDGVNDRENPGTYNLRLTSSVTVTDVNGTSYLFVAGEEDDGISVFMVAADGSLSYVGGVDDGDGNYKLDGAWSLTTLKVAENNYLFVGGYVDDGVSVFRVTAEGLLSHAYSVGDTDNVLYQLDGVISVTTAKINGANYLFVAGDADDGISVFSVMANGSLLHTNSIDDNDDGSYQLGGATPVSVVNIDGANYLYVGGVKDEGISAFSILANGSLAHLANYPGDSHNAYKLGKVRVMKVTEIAGISYLFVGGFDAGVNVFSIAANGYLNHVDDVYDIEGEYMLNYPVSITTADINGTIYLFVGGLFDNRISVFNVAVNGSLSYVTRINDGDNNAYRFQGTVSMVVSELGGVSYLFAAGFHDNGVSVFSIAANGHLNYVTSVDSTSGAKLQGARSVITHVIGEVTYLFVASFLDDGVSMFRVAANGNLSYVDSIDDGDDLAYELDGAVSMDIVKIGDASYLFVAGYEDDGISVFSIAADSSLSHLTSISDDEDPAYTLDAIRFLTVAAIEGTNYLFASGFFDNGASVFKFNFAGNSKNN